jgi:hypothetical protein
VGCLLDDVLVRHDRFHLLSSQRKSQTPPSEGLQQIVENRQSYWFGVGAQAEWDFAQGPKEAKVATA